MKFTSLCFLIFSGVFASIAANAQGPSSTCQESNPLSGSIQAQVMRTSKGCSVMLSPSTETDPFRSFTFAQRGLIQIFNMYVGNKNGSRSFFVFPRAKTPSLNVINANEMDVTTASGDLIKFNTSVTPPQIIDDPSASFRLIESPSVSASNNGGVEVLQAANSQTLVLDSGFQLGSPGFTHPTRTSTFMDANGNHCTMLNSKLFTFANYDADLKFKTDVELFDFLKTACPTLVLPALQ